MSSAFLFIVGSKDVIVIASFLFYNNILYSPLYTIKDNRHFFVLYAFKSRFSLAGLALSSANMKLAFDFPKKKSVFHKMFVIIIFCHFVGTNT